MDPLIASAIAGAAGGATGKLIEKAWNSGQRWLATYFKDHQPKAQESAEKNALDFLSELANRVHVIEETAKNIPDAKKQIEDALADPDFSALLKDTIIASGRTGSSEKHKLLARVVSEKLLAGQESLVALTGNLACDAIPHLSSKHLRCLGVVALVHGIRPYSFPPNISPEKFHDWWTTWLSDSLFPLMPVGKMANIDYAHLMSVSCIIYESIVFTDLKEALSPPKSSALKWDADKFLTEIPIGKELSELWKAGMEHALPTSVGRLIGIYVNDLLTETKTKIKWE